MSGVERRMCIINEGHFHANEFNLHAFRISGHYYADYIPLWFRYGLSVFPKDYIREAQVPGQRRDRQTFKSLV